MASITIPMPVETSVEDLEPKAAEIMRMIFPNSEQPKSFKFTKVIERLDDRRAERLIERYLSRQENPKGTLEERMEWVREYEKLQAELKVARAAAAAAATATNPSVTAAEPTTFHMTTPEPTMKAVDIPTKDWRDRI